MLSQFLKRDRFLLAVLLALVLLLALPTLTYPLGRDQGEFATIGRGILQGRIPYTQLWNPKPPAVFYIYAIFERVLGQTAVAVRAIDFVLVPLACAGLYWIARQMGRRRIGLWAALLFSVFYFSETFWTLTQNDGIALLPMVLAVGCWLKVVSYQLSDASQEDSVPRPQFAVQLWAFAAGVLCGYVVWFKYPFALLGVTLALYYVRVRWQTRKTAPLRRVDAYTLALFITGGLLALAVGALYLMSAGAWDELIRSAQVTSQYTALTFNWNDFKNLMGTALYFRIQQWGLLMLLALVGIIAAIGYRFRANRMRPPQHSTLSTQHSLFLLLWLAAAFAMMLVQAKGYDYHWLPMLAPLALLGAIGVEWVIGTIGNLVAQITVGAQHAAPLRATSLPPAKLPSPVEGSEAGIEWGFNRFLSLCLCGLLILIMAANIWPKAWPYLTGQEDQAAYYDHFVAGAADEFNAGDSLRVANLLRERTAVGDSLYIWGFRPDVYYLSGLNPATRFIFQFPLVGSWYPPEWQQENVDTLWAALPPYVLVLEVDYMPWVTGSNDDSNTLLQGYTELNNWLIYNYERDTQIGHFFVWRRKS
ncbi:MAG: glycosyltransferase family 39 protein [Anaerolineae bacterium]